MVIEGETHFEDLGAQRYRIVRWCTGRGVLPADHHGNALKAGHLREQIVSTLRDTVRSVGSGERVLQWRPQAGDWTVVVMNADASAGLSIRGDAGATVPALPWIASGLLVAGGILLILGTVLIVIPLRRQTIHRAADA